MPTKTRKAASRSPREYFRSRTVSAACDVCGRRPEVVHMPICGKGFRCAEHCENCGPPPEGQADHRAGRGPKVLPGAGKFESLKQATRSKTQ